MNEKDMENQPKNNKYKKIIIAFSAILIVAVCALIVVIVTGRQDASMQATATQVASDTPEPTFTPDMGPVITVPVEPVATPTPEIEILPSYEEDVVWINLSHLKMRAEPDFDYTVIARIPYGTKVMGEIDGIWMYTSYGGVAGYIYIGNVKSTGRPCVVKSYGALQPLD